MIWPFKKRETIPFEEHVKTLPMPDCGDPVKHYTYEYNGAECMDCRFIQAAELEEQRENRLARKVAEEVVRQIKERK